MKIIRPRLRVFLDLESHQGLRWSAYSSQIYSKGCDFDTFRTLRIHMAYFWPVKCGINLSEIHHSVLRNLAFSLAYLDDIQVAFFSECKHLTYRQWFLSRFLDNGVIVNVPKAFPRTWWYTKEAYGSDTCGHANYIAKSDHFTNTAPSKKEERRRVTIWCSAGATPQVFPHLCPQRKVFIAADSVATLTVNVVILNFATLAETSAAAGRVCTSWMLAVTLGRELENFCRYTLVSPACPPIVVDAPRASVA